MQREIKFRAWDGRRCLAASDVYVGQVGIMYDQGSSNMFWRFSDLSVMQYTGLKDKNGVEIYEGDIVELEPYLKRGRAAVVFKQGSFGLDLSLIFSPLQLTFSQQIEVIGNIYENPELLEEKE